MAASALKVTGGQGVDRNGFDCTATLPNTGFSLLIWVRLDGDHSSGVPFGTIWNIGDQAAYIYSSAGVLVDYPAGVPGLTFTSDLWYWISVIDNGSNARAYEWGTTPGTALSSGSAALHLSSSQSTIGIGSDVYNDQNKASFCAAKAWNTQLTAAQLRTESLYVNPQITSGLVAFNSGKYNDGRAEASMPIWTIQGTVTIVSDGPSITDDPSTTSIPVMMSQQRRRR